MDLPGKCGQEAKDERYAVSNITTRPYVEGVPRQICTRMTWSGGTYLYVSAVIDLRLQRAP